MAQRTAPTFSLLLLVVILTATGCAAPAINANDPVQVGRNIRVEHDDFQKITTYTGPNCAPNQIDHVVLIRAFKTRTETVAFQVYVSDTYTYERLRRGSGWKFYSMAHDSDGNSLPTDVISRHVNWCGSNVCQYLEIVGVRITREYLEAHASRGIAIKISGTGGEGIFTVPAAYVQAFLRSVPDIQPPIGLTQ